MVTIVTMIMYAKNPPCGSKIIATTFSSSTDFQVYMSTTPAPNVTQKLMPLAEAIAKFVNNGDTVYAAGFTHLIPFAAGHEIIRQGKRDLTLVRATPDLIYD